MRILCLILLSAVMYESFSSDSLLVRDVYADLNMNSGQETYGQAAPVQAWRVRVTIMWELIRELLRLHTGSSIVSRSISSEVELFISCGERCSACSCIYFQYCTYGTERE